MSHFTTVERINLNVRQQYDTTGWTRRHVDAWLSPRAGVEEALRNLIRSAARYADDYHDRYGMPIGEDAVMGVVWSDMVRGIRGLLNGETGRLDAGTLGACLVGMLEREGFEA